MSSAKPVTTLIATLAVTTMLGAVPAAAHSGDIAEVYVKSRAPTELRISIAGKQGDIVRNEVSAAARLVCRNAAKQGEMQFPFIGACARDARTRALQQYAQLLERTPAAELAGLTLVLAAR